MVPWGVVAALSCVVVAGCGSTGAPSGTVTNAQSGQTPTFVAFARCMRANGVPDMPDSGKITLGSGINPSAPAFHGALQVCKKQLPGGGPPAHASEQQKQQMVATSECMRRHGISGFPDPVTATGPPSTSQEYSIAEAIGNLALLVPRTINVNSPAFKQAADACEFH